MLDIIQLLPDSIANQIAAGEVVQRPASVIKELLENAVDARASNVQVIIKDAGKTLIQVIDDGLGMSVTDARMSFERHATSKIRNADDLFKIRTMGFRGEALASIAAIAQIEMKTRRTNDELGILIKIEASELKQQEAVSAPKGTSIQVRNLFYNVPARRNFLKSNPVEMKHILDEFQRVALAQPEVSFTLFHNDVEVFALPAGKLSKRIVDIFGKSYREQLATCQEETSFVSVSGFVGKPESAKKGRGEQFFFVNNRFIKHNYLHHAVLSAFEATIPEGYSPFYVLFIDIDPSHIDINIHPTKTEIKFDDERAVYAIVRAAVKKSLSVYNLTPSIDFESDINFFNLANRQEQIGSSDVDTPKTIPSSSFLTHHSADSVQRFERENTQNWQKMFEGLDITRPDLGQSERSNNTLPLTLGSKVNALSNSEEELDEEATFMQIHQQYILTQSKSGLLLIDQRAAHERILYERYLSFLQKSGGHSQQLLFPKTLAFSPSDFMSVMDIQEEIRALGFSFEEFGKNTLLINGVPADVQDENEKEMFESLVKQYQENLENLHIGKKENVARAFAKRSATKYTGKLSHLEMKLLVHQLFETSTPTYTPTGEAVFKSLPVADLAIILQN